MLQYLAKKARLSIAWCGSGVWKERHHAANFAVAGRRPADVPELEELGNGAWRAPGARIIDRSGGKRLPIGYDGWADAMGGLGGGFC